MSEVKEFKRPENTARKFEAAPEKSRSRVLKTYKLYINGQFPRTESGRFTEVQNPNGEFIGNVCRASRKDVREAVVAARNAFPKWSAASAYNRGQILYRIAEILEDRRAQFELELTRMGLSAEKATTELDCCIDRLVHFAGWSDKFQQLSSTVNPVASSHFVFSSPEPTGVVAGIAATTPALLSLISILAPTMVSGNTCVLIAGESNPLPAITFAEVLQASDVPAGVVNILTGQHEELLPVLSGHMDVNALMAIGVSQPQSAAILLSAANNVKRTVLKESDWVYSSDAESPYPILALTETKTTWHPVGK